MHDRSNSTLYAMEISPLKFRLGQVGRDLLAAAKYPAWALAARQAPDNHVYKKARINRIAKRYQCSTFVETGTFYGQMVNFAKSRFIETISIEIFEPFFKANQAFFSAYPNVHILSGDSGKCLPRAMDLAKGRIVFWLDGHYSGTGTGIGDKVSPIIEELRLIANAGVSDHCIVIDDKRLFDGSGGYPTIEDTRTALRNINPSYNIYFDQDSIVALP